MDTSAVARIGLTRLSPSSTDEDAKIDVIVVHGLFGHPYHTWTYEARGSKIHEARATAPEPPKRHSSTGLRSAIFKRFKELNPRHRPPHSINHAASHPTEVSREENVEHGTILHSDGVGTLLESNTKLETGSIFWPHHFLVKDLPNARILSWGYDADVAKAFDFASQSSVSQHASQLLSDLANERTTPCQRTRPLILISHSLGGIVVKDALGKAQTTKLEHLQNILPSVIGVCFLGTPHRGSSTASLGKVAYNITRLIWSHPSTGLLESLKRNSNNLERISERFAELLDERRFKVHSFRETKPTKGMMIVETFSSRVGDANEGQDEIQANHMDMTKFPSRMDPGYRRLLAVLNRWSADIQATQTEEVERMMRKSLQCDETRFRMNTVERNHVGTFEWMFSDSVPFRAWPQGSESQVFWIRGKPGSGKSTAMKFAMNSEETCSYLRHCSSQPWVLSGFFFYDRGSELQRSFRGLLTEILYSLVEECSEFSRLVLPIYERLLEKTQATIIEEPKSTISSAHEERPAPLVFWTDEDLLRGLRAVFFNASESNVCLFIDGLDEHHGPHRQIFDLFDELVETTESRTTHVKLCLAGRPEPEFLDRFWHHPGFQIHEHTASDILTYVRSRLSSGISRTRLEAKKPLIGSLVKEISKAADGVFIWARLVVDLLLEGLQHGDDARALFDLIREVPTELQDLYVFAVKRMRAKRNATLARRRRYDSESYCMFQLALGSDHSIELRFFMDMVGRAMIAFYNEDDESMRPKSGHVIQRHAERLYVPWRGAADAHTGFMVSTGADTAEDLSLRLASRSGGLLEHVHSQESLDLYRSDDEASMWSSKPASTTGEPVSPAEGSLSPVKPSLPGIELESSTEDSLSSAQESVPSVMQGLNSERVQFIHQTAKECIGNTIKHAQLIDGLPARLAQITGRQIIVEYWHSRLMEGDGDALPDFLADAFDLEHLENTDNSRYFERLGSGYTWPAFQVRTFMDIGPFTLIMQSGGVESETMRPIQVAASAGLYLSVQKLLAQYLEKKDLNSWASSHCWMLLLASMCSLLRPLFRGKTDHHARTFRTVIQQLDMHSLEWPIKIALRLLLKTSLPKRKGYGRGPGSSPHWCTLLAVLLESGWNPNTLIDMSSSSNDDDASIDYKLFNDQDSSDRNVSIKIKRRVLTINLFEDWLGVAALLLKNGADPSLPDEDGITPLEYAVNENKTAFVQLFEQHTAGSS